jgi:methionyl-tRNA synthetase
LSRPRYYLTTPIYYVNDEPHIGHAYTTVVADVTARYRRATGHDVRFLTGTDEHGQKIERAARGQGLAPIALADRVVERYHALWKRLDIRHDDFIRTTEPRHRAGVVQLIQKMKAAGDVYLGAYEGMYCAGCEAFYPESQIVNGRCPEHGHPVERVSEESYFFRLSKYAEPLLEHYRKHPGFVKPASRFNEVKAFVESGLKDLSISRTSITWGIPFPDAPGHVVYVWVDALTNYMSALGYGVPQRSPLLDYWPAQVHLVGKDILRFHAVYWPAFLLSAGEPLPQCVFAHGWWLRNETKMSKSLGNVVSPWPLLDTVGSDGLRYFLLREMTFGLDGSFSDEQLLDRYNADLANDLGNLTSRIVTLLDSAGAGTLSPPTGAPEESALRAPAESAFGAYRAAFDAYDFSGGLTAAWELAAEVNRFLVQHAPWAERDVAKRIAVLRGAAEALLQVAAMAAPVMPGACAEIAARLGTELPSSLAEFRWGLLPATGAVRKGAPVFPRVDKTAYFQKETTVEDKAHDKPVAPAAAANPGDGSGLIGIEQFLTVDLRVGIVRAAARIEGADKLLDLRVDVGTEERRIVAGIAKAYEPEALVGKRVVVVANLKPAKLRGVESQGMLLAADLGGRPFVVTFDEEVAPGTRVR